MRTMHGLVERQRQDARGTATIFQFRMAVTEWHRDYLAKWLDAGVRMGLHDADICSTDGHGGTVARHVVIWVRENADPAYAVVPRGTMWEVRDCIRCSPLGTFRTFEAALDFIRPVLDLRQVDLPVAADGTAA